MRRASVNNFGYGGSNAHAIIEHADYLVPYYRDKLNLTKIAQENPPGRLRILKVSAKSESSTISQLSNIQNYLKNQISNHGDVDIFLDRLVYTLGQKRSTYSWSSAISFSEPGEIIDLESVKPQRATQIPRIGFVFSGQGAQWYAMGRELIATYPVFRGALQEADSHLQELGASWSLIGMFFPNNDEKWGNTVCKALFAIRRVVTLFISWHATITRSNGLFILLDYELWDDACDNPRH